MEMVLGAVAGFGAAWPLLLLLLDRGDTMRRRWRWRRCVGRACCGVRPAGARRAALGRPRCSAATCVPPLRARESARSRYAHFCRARAECLPMPFPARFMGDVEGPCMRLVAPMCAPPMRAMALAAGRGGSVENVRGEGGSASRARVRAAARSRGGSHS